MRAAEIAEALHAKRSGEGFMARCPAHDDKTPSLSISDGDKGPVVHCFAGCSQAEVLAALEGHGINLRKPNGHSNDIGLIVRPAPQPLTLAALAEAKQLEPELLISSGVQQVGDAIGFEYRGLDGAITGMKFRRGLTGDRGFSWRRGSVPCLYGLWNYARYRGMGNRVILCEGETDTLTLWQRGYCALGLPGATTWRDEWLDTIDPNDSIYVAIEPDKGGESLEKIIGKSALKGRAKLVRMPAKTKDPSALYLADPAKFNDTFETMLTNAKPWGYKEPRKSSFRHASEIVANPIPVHWLLRPYLEQGVLSLLYGELGTLKSFVTLDMMLAIASGKSWGGAPYPVKKLPVCYISAEGRGLEKRLRAWSIHHGVDLAQVQFYALERAVDLSTPEKVAEIADDIAALDIVPAMIAVDTLSKNKGPLDENDTSEMATFLQMLDLHLRQRFQCTVQLVHHTGHSAKDRGRGSYTLMADTDANYRVERPDQAELIIKITTGRLKDSESPSPLYIKAHIVELGTQDEDGQMETSLVLLPTDEKPLETNRRPPSGERQRSLLRLLEKQHREGLTTWDQATIRKMARDMLAMSKSSAQDAVAALIDHGWVKLTIGGVTLSDPPEK